MNLLLIMRGYSLPAGTLVVQEDYIELHRLGALFGRTPPEILLWMNDAQIQMSIDIMRADADSMPKGGS